MSAEKDIAGAEIEHLEKGVKTESLKSSKEQRAVEDFDVRLAAKLRHKIDFRLIPALALMYAICLLDRNNLSNAAIAGMLVELNLLTGIGQ